jgi:arginyl-tRNA synthetase
MGYTSSIVTKYGDLMNLRADVKTLHDILDRQGASLLVDVIAESIGVAAIRFNMTDEERARAISNVIEELKQSILERT